MTQQLSYDFTQAATRDTDYFYPLDLKIVPEEKQRFLSEVVASEQDKFLGKKIGLSNIAFTGGYFKRTQAQTEAFVKPLGLRVHRTTFFMSSEGVTSWVLHADGVNVGEERGLLLEARLSYYEMAVAPGAMRWWKDLPMKRVELEPDAHSFSRVYHQAVCAEDLRDDKITWSDIPPPDFSTVTSTPSAILRTNLPHHVIQGPGLRATISFQLVFENGRPEGVWEHIQKNIHLLGA